VAGAASTGNSRPLASNTAEWRRAFDMPVNEV
jgi:hypothetical protein